MTRVDTSWTSQVDYAWIKKNYEEITNHAAWSGDVPESEANKLLEGKSVFTYILRNAGKEHAYFISFVQEDRSIKHQLFTLELDRKGWYYKNGLSVTAETLGELIPRMMHCGSDECKAFERSRS